MNCAEWEQLLDAYLDRHLAGSLRLEFDTHRLSCRRCQQTLSMMEACEHVIAGDAPARPLSDVFTDSVMSAISGVAPAASRRRLRLIRLFAGVASAAAVVALALVTWQWRTTPGAGGGGAADASPEIALLDPYAPGIDEVERSERAFALITERIRQKLDASVAAGRALSSETIALANYLNLDLPADVARNHLDFATVDPIGGIFLKLLSFEPAAEPSDPEPADETSGTRI